jgi:hypothetical protein
MVIFIIKFLFLSASISADQIFLSSKRYIFLIVAYLSVAKTFMWGHSVYGLEILSLNCF